jgi:FkbM family methyltransferase
MPQSDLIFDVGMHLGEDTDFYLKKGFRVVSFEANSTLVQHCRVRFSDAIASGRLVIVHGAVCPGTDSTVPFYENLRQTEWGTLNLDWVARNQQRGAPSKVVEVKRVDLAEYFRKYGMPYYLKIDIEGTDLAAASSVEELEDRPQFISIETEINRFGRALGEIELLRSLGYCKFKPVQQQTIMGTRLMSRTRDGTSFEHVFERGASGPFGDDLTGEWLDYATVRRAYRAIFTRYRAVGHLSPFYKLYVALVHMPRWHTLQKRLERVINSAGWHDLHASL